MNDSKNTGTVLRLQAPTALTWGDYRLLVESVQEYAMFLLDATGHVVTWNHGAERIKGYKPEDIIGKHFSVFYPPEDIAANKPGNELEIARDEGRLEDEGWRLRKDGTPFWANVVITALFDQEGTLRGFGKITRDLTAQRMAQEQLRRSEERFRLLVEAVTDYAIYMLDAEGCVATWNLGAQRTHGYPSDEVIGRHFSLFFRQEDVDAGKPALELELARSKGHFEEEGFRLRKDGTSFWANVVLTSIRDAAGKLVGFAKITRDLTGRLATEEAARALIREQAARSAAQENEARIRESEERYRVLSNRLEVILEGIADGVSVQDHTGKVIFANTASARTWGFTNVHEFLRASPNDILAGFELLNENGAPFDLNELPGRAVLRGEPPRGVLLQVRERATGLTRWSLIRASGVFDGEGKAELAINVLHDVTAERRREQHERHLVQATTALSSSLDYHEMLSRFARVLAPGLGDWCVIHMLEQRALTTVAVAHTDPEKVRFARELGEKYPPDPSRNRGAWQVLRTGKPELYTDIPDALLAEQAKDEAHLEVLRSAGMRSVVMVPIRIRDRVSGTLTLVAAESHRRYDEDDVALLTELGRRAGTAIENARLFAAEKLAREQLALLARAGEAFSSATSYEETLRSVVDTALPALGDFAFFDVVEGAEVRRLSAAHEAPDTEAFLKGTRWIRSERRDRNLCALSSGVTGFHPHIDEVWMQDVASGPEHMDLLKTLKVTSLLTVPLRAQGELLGSLTVCFAQSGRHHTEDDMWLAEELSRRAAISLVQVRLYARAQESARQAADAARRAEEASRVKDEFLATVSHELRTPLNAIVGWSSLLLGRNPPPAMAKGIDVIHRNARTQAKIIEDILDVSRIITGKLRLEPKPIDLVAIVRDALEVIRPSALAKNLTIEFTPPGDECVLVADPERLQQVVWNLLSNAVKFTDAGGRIVATILHEGARLVVRVSDNGRGIAPEFLPFVFDRFKQADSSTTRGVGGLGLGLSIVRHIVELHGGQVQAESEGPGMGARFTITLPVRAVAPLPEDPDASWPGEESEAPAAKSSLSGMKVLVVDDEGDARELVQTVLSEAGALVETAGSAAQGLELILRFRPDVLVSDIGMPEMDGYGFIQQVKALPAEAGGGIPSIALTAYTRAIDKSKALAMGFTTHIGKPVNPSDLIAAVANLAALVHRGTR